MPKYFNGLIGVIMSNPAADEREQSLNKISHILSNISGKNRTLTMGQLSLKFYRHTRLAEDCVSGNEIAGAEGHMLIAECIHHTLKTLEVKQRKSQENSVARES